MQEKKLYKVKLLGKNYTLSGYANETHVKTVESLFNQQYKQIDYIAKDLDTVDKLKLMVFNALSTQLELQHDKEILEHRLAELEQAEQQKAPAKTTNKKSAELTIEKAKQESAQKDLKLFKK